MAVKTKPLRTGLFFGSFNPVHIGHMALAGWFLGENYLDRIWFVLSPQNPFKPRASLLAFHHRAELLRLAIGDDHRLQVCEVEKHLPLPSYTVNTVRLLKERYPHTPFYLIMGADNALSFGRWREAEWLAEHCDFLVYPRLVNGRVLDNLPGENALYKNFVMAPAPIIEVSSSQIRTWLGRGISVRHFMPEAAWRYLEEMHFYQKPSPKK
jgi:nicotinate-nucleotide adenylyltransferase